MLFMTPRQRENVGEMELLDRVLDKIWDIGEVKESDLYGLTSSKGRIRPVLEDLHESGILDVRIREYGQRVPLYSYTSKGRFYYTVHRLAKELRSSEGEIDLDAEEMVAIRDNLRMHFGIKFEEDRTK